MTVLQHLIESFKAARAARIAAAEPYDPKRTTCRYCGKHWRKWHGSVLDGHAKCIVTGEFKQSVKRVLERDPTITYERVAAALGLTPAIVRAWTFPIRGGK